MTKENNLILVTGATGQQGNAVAHALLKNGWRVRAFTRNADSPAALSLQAAGVEICQGNNNDAYSLKLAFTNVYGAFIMLPTEHSPGVVPEGFGYEDEIRQAKKLVDAAKQARIAHLVYSSVAGAKHLKGTRNFSKAVIKAYIADSGLPATILRPVWFMENFSNPLTGIKNGKFRAAIDPKASIQLIAVKDIGGLTAFCFDSPTEVINKQFEIAGDDLTPIEIVEMINKHQPVTPVDYEYIPIAVIRTISESAARMYELINEKSFKANIKCLRSNYPELLRFNDWLKNNPLDTKFIE